MTTLPGTRASEARLESEDAASVTVDGVRMSFDELPVLDGLDLRIGAREVIGIVGPSGCGKSTLLELISGLREPAGGAIEIARDDVPVTRRLDACAYMPQRDLLLPWLSAIDNGAVALRNRGIGRNEARRLAGPLFERFGLGAFEHAMPAELSGGMRQRVAFLRTLLSGKPVLLLDEPFAALDAITRGDMQEWLAGALALEPRTVVLVTHDVEEALYLCDRVAVLSPRPARVEAELEVPSPRSAPRIDAITSAELSELRERALQALGGGAR